MYFYFACTGGILETDKCVLDPYRDHRSIYNLNPKNVILKAIWFVPRMKRSYFDEKSPNNWRPDTITLRREPMPDKDRPYLKRDLTGNQFDIKRLYANNINSELLNVEVNIKAGYDALHAFAPVLDDLVGFEIYSTQFKESAPWDGTSVQFEAEEKEGRLVWSIRNANRGATVLVSLNGGTSLEEAHRWWPLVMRDDVTWISGNIEQAWPSAKLDVDVFDRNRPLSSFPTEKQSLELKKFKPSKNIPVRFLFQGTRGLRVFWRIWEVGKGWVDD
jgi:hypothetical protein